MSIISKNLLVILGNGFTIDFLNQIKRLDINVTNLFANGDKVPWLSDNEPGFLSYKRCPNLWNLGARSNNGNQEANSIVENIITCANVYAYAKKSTRPVDEDSIYIKAYKELVAYLKYLFIFYNDKIQNDEISNHISNWGWQELFSKIKTKRDIFNKVTIITYNYDIWLERIFDVMEIKYNIVGLTNNENSIVDIIKPHGSISFRSDRILENSAFKINYNRDLFGAKLEQIVVDSINLMINSTINAMIPPAGDSSRFLSTWSNQLHEEAKKSASRLIQDDEVIISGLSYWHVDRLEMDEILLALDSEVNMKIINPKSPSSFDAVVSSIFSNYVAYSSSDILGGLYE